MHTCRWYVPITCVCMRDIVYGIGVHTCIWYVCMQGTGYRGVSTCVCVSLLGLWFHERACQTLLAMSFAGWVCITIFIICGHQRCVELWMGGSWLKMSSGNRPHHWGHLAVPSCVDGITFDMSTYTMAETNNRKYYNPWALQLYWCVLVFGWNSIMYCLI